MNFRHPMAQLTKSSSVLLALAGLSSALLTLALPIKGHAFQFCVGLCFGVALALYFVAYEGHRNPLKIVAFICACTAAYSVAEFCAVRLFLILPSKDSAPMNSASLNIPMPIFFFAGCLGAYLVFMAGMYAFGPQDLSLRSLLMVLLWSIGGGLLGIAGGCADGLLKYGTYQHSVLLFLIWQPGAAVLLGLLLSLERKAQPTTHPSAAGASWVTTLSSAVFFASVLGLLGYLVALTLKGERLASARLEAHRRVIAQAPPMGGLPPVQQLPLQQTLIVEKIAGFVTSPPKSNLSGHSANLPPARSYSIEYVMAEDQLRPQVVAVNITQWPSEEWARYQIKYPNIDMADDSQTLSTVTRFGQTIARDADGTFRWPSRNFVVSVSCNTPEIKEEFLEKYLAKYPSSL